MQLHSYEEIAVIRLKLISHKLCPYVQRAVIALTEKGVSFERADVDLSNKPDWFRAISPLGKTPVLLVTRGEGFAIGQTIATPRIFELAVILEYLEETQFNRAASRRSARARRTSLLDRVRLGDPERRPGLYTAPDQAAFDAKAAALRVKFVRVETRLKGPLFDGERFSLVDAVFGPVFRYFDAFDRIGDFGVLTGLPNVAAWRGELAARPSVQTAVSPGYPALLWDFYRARGSHLSRLMDGQKLAA